MNGMAKTETKSAGKLRAAAVLLAAALIAVLALCVGGRVYAAEGLEMSTTYPGITATAGDEVDFTISFENGTGAGMVVDLEESSLPTDWEGYFVGDSEITQVYLTDGSNDSVVEYDVTIPETESDGTYKVVLKASSGEYSATLTLTIDVTAQEEGANSFEADSDSEEGAAGDIFSYDLTITNNSNEDATYELTDEAPDGWSAVFEDSDENTITEITVSARGSETVTYSVSAPSDAAADDFSMTVTAASDDETFEVELTATIEGEYEIYLTTSTGLLSTDAYANKQQEIVLELTNNGNTDLEDVELTATTPDDWEVSFSEDEIELIEVGETVEVTAFMTPAEDALAGDYSFTIKASGDASDSIEIRVTVETRTIWGIVGVALIVLVFVGLAFVFRKYGRR